MRVSSHKGKAPAGQPLPNPRVKYLKSGKEHPVFVFPHEILRVMSKKDLEGKLRHYAHPFPMLDGSPHPKHPAAMKHMVEWVFPALRWFCHVYDEEIPPWLQGNGFADDMGSAEKKRLMGTDKLEVREWRERKGQEGDRA